MGKPKKGLYKKKRPLLLKRISSIFKIEVGTNFLDTSQVRGFCTEAKKNMGLMGGKIKQGKPLSKTDPKGFKRYSKNASRLLILRTELEVKKRSHTSSQKTGGKPKKGKVNEIRRSVKAELKEQYIDYCKKFNAEPEKEIARLGFIYMKMIGEIERLCGFLESKGQRTFHIETK